MCALSGLSVVELQAHGGLPEIQCDLTTKGLGYLPGPLPTLLRPFQTAASLLGATWPARKLSASSKASYPLGYVVVLRKGRRGLLADSGCDVAGRFDFHTAIRMERACALLGLPGAPRNMTRGPWYQEHVL